MKVMGKGELPKQAVIVKARYFTKEAETKIKEAEIPQQNIWPCLFGICEGILA